MVSWTTDTIKPRGLEQYLVQRFIALQQIIPHLLRHAAEAVAL
jgi:hypothetical protein